MGVVNTVDSATDIITFLVMFILTCWTLIKYRKQQNDRFFVFSLCMFPFAYFLLALGTSFYLVADTIQENDQVYDFISTYMLPFNYLILWTIELLLCFEMELIRVKLTADLASECQKKIRLWKIIRFITILFSTIFNLLKIVSIDFEKVSNDKDHTDFPNLTSANQFLFLLTFSLTIFCSLAFAVLLISNLEFFMHKFWLKRLAIVGLSAQTSLESLKKDNFELHMHLAKTKKSFNYLRSFIWLIVLRKAIYCTIQLLFVVNYRDSILFEILSYSYRAFLENTIDCIEFCVLCWLYRAQYSFSQNQEAGRSETDIIIESQGTGYLESEDSGNRYTMRQLRTKNGGKTNQISVKNAIQTAGIENSAGNQFSEQDLESNDFDDSIMIKNKYRATNRIKRNISGMEGYNSDEDQDHDQLVSSIQETENEVAVMEEELIQREVKIVVQEQHKVTSLADKVDIFDGRLEQFNKFLEFIVLPKVPVTKASIIKQNTASFKVLKSETIKSSDLQQN